MVWSSYPLWPRTLQKVRSLCWMLMAEDGRQQLSWFLPLPRVTDGWDVSNTTLWSPTLLYVESLQQRHIVQKSVVQQLVQCKDVSLVHHQPSDTHTPLCCPTTALVTPYCGDQKDLSQSRQIELWLWRRQLRCKVTSDRLKAPSSKSECSEWTLSLSRTVGCFWRIGYNSWL